VVLPAFVRDNLAAHIAAYANEPDGLVFTSPRGQSLGSSNFRRRVWLPATARANLDATPVIRLFERLMWTECGHLRSAQLLRYGPERHKALC
jgi:hypothetical protein